MLFCFFAFAFFLFCFAKGDLNSKECVLKCVFDVLSKGLESKIY